MPFSHIVNGKVLDVTTKKLSKTSPAIAVYLGDEYIGQIFKMRFGWDVVPRYPVQPLGIISGVINKWKTYEILLKLYDHHHNKV